MNNFFIGIFHGELECLLAANECNDTLSLVEPKEVTAAAAKARKVHKNKVSKFEEFAAIHNSA